jgi:hypothetical protein
LLPLQSAISDRIVTSSRYNDLVRMDRQRGHGADCQHENDAGEDEYFHDQAPVIESARTVLLPTVACSELIGRDVTAVTKSWFCGNWPQPATAAAPRDVKFE